MTVQYTDLIKHFGSPAKVDRAVACAYLGYKIHGIPADWDWDQIIQHFHVPARTLIFLGDIAMRKLGVDVEAELF